MREIAGGEPIKLGTLSKRDDDPANAAKIFKGLAHARRKSVSGPKSHEEFEPYDHDDPVQRIFNKPNVNDVAYDHWAYHTLFYKTCGIAYWWVRRNTFGMIHDMWVVPTHWVRLQTGYDGQPDHYLVQSPWGQMTRVPYDEMVTFVEHSPLNRYEGFGTSQAIAEWIDMYESLVRMRLAVFKNGAVPSFHVALGESYLDPDEAFLARFYAKWYARFQGEDNSGKPIITGPDVTLKGVEGHRPADALLASNLSEEQSRDEQLAAYGVPKAIVGLTNDMTYGSVQASMAAFRAYGVNSELTYMGQKITEDIIRRTPGREHDIAFWEDRATGDPAFILTEQIEHLDRGVKTINEIRSENGLPPYPNGGNNPIVDGVEMPWVEDVAENDELDGAEAELDSEKPELDLTEGLEQRPDGAMVARSLRRKSNDRPHEISYVDYGHDENKGNKIWWLKDNGDLATIVPRSGDIYDNILGAKTAFWRGRYDASKDVVTLLNVAYGGAEEREYVESLLNIEFPTAKVVYFKSLSEGSGRSGGYTVQPQHANGRKPNPKPSSLKRHTKKQLHEMYVARRKALSERIKAIQDNARRFYSSDDRETMHGGHENYPIEVDEKEGLPPTANSARLRLLSNGGQTTREYLADIAHNEDR